MDRRRLFKSGILGAMTSLVLAGCAQFSGQREAPTGMLVAGGVRSVFYAERQDCAAPRGAPDRCRRSS
jgi:hypothetical protein